MHVQIERRAKTLDEGNRAGSGRGVGETRGTNQVRCNAAVDNILHMLSEKDEFQYVKWYVKLENCSVKSVDLVTLDLDGRLLGEAEFPGAGEAVSGTIAETICGLTYKADVTDYGKEI